MRWSNKRGGYAVGLEFFNKISWRNTWRRSQLRNIKVYKLFQRYLNFHFTWGNFSILIRLLRYTFGYQNLFQLYISLWILNELLLPLQNHGHRATPTMVPPCLFVHGVLFTCMVYFGIFVFSCYAQTVFLFYVDPINCIFTSLWIEINIPF